VNSHLCYFSLHCVICIRGGYMITVNMYYITICLLVVTCNACVAGQMICYVPMSRMDMNRCTKVNL